MKNQTNQKCPVCGVSLVSQSGDQIDPKNGITVWCDNRNCSAQEVSGHGKNEKEAWITIMQKFKRDIVDK